MCDNEDKSITLSKEETQVNQENQKQPKTKTEERREKTNNENGSMSLSKRKETQENQVKQQEPRTTTEERRERTKNEDRSMSLSKKEETQENQEEPKTETEERKEARFVNLSHRQISSNLASILEKGPKFALSQKVTPTTLLAVEAGIERAFYGVKWQHVIEKQKSNTTEK